MDWKQRARKARDEKNKEIARKLKAGEYIEAKVDMEEIWYPRRPAVKKDQREVRRLFGEEKFKVIE